MALILDNLEPKILEKLQNQATRNGRTLIEEIKIILINETQKDNIEIYYNPWGKPLNKKSIQNTINEIKELRKSINIDKNEIREMRDEARRF